MNTDFVQAFQDYSNIQKKFFERTVTPLQHSREREMALGSALRAIAEDFGHKLREPVHINSSGEFTIQVVSQDQPQQWDRCGHFGKDFAELLNRHWPRCGAFPGAWLKETNGHCYMNHFDVEKLVTEYATHLGLKQSEQATPKAAPAPAVPTRSRNRMR